MIWISESIQKWLPSCMPHIHTADYQHDHTVTAYIVRVDGDEPKVLLHMHRKLKMLLPAGGHVELTETPWQAVAHEVLEEAGFKLEQLEVLQPRSRIKNITNVVQHPYPISMNTHDFSARHFHSDTEYALIAHSDPVMNVAKGESTDLRWLSNSELDALPKTLIYDSTREVYHFILDEALKQWDRVPATDFSLGKSH